MDAVPTDARASNMSADAGTNVTGDDCVSTLTMVVERYTSPAISRPAEGTYTLPELFYCGWLFLHATLRTYNPELDVQIFCFISGRSAHFSTHKECASCINVSVKNTKIPNQSANHTTKQI